jgi:glycosyltransferase involved in cell wall biosynthesis
VSEDAGNPRALLLIPSYAREVSPGDIVANLHPTMDYYALQARAGGDIVDYAAVDADPHPLVKLARRVSRNLALATIGYLRGATYDVIFSNSESVSLPLALMFKASRRRPAHVVIGHRLSTPKKKALLRLTHRHMDTIFVYSSVQQRYAETQLGIPSSRLRLIPFHADTRFFAAGNSTTGARPRIVSAGLELRDYPTLLEAVRGLDVDVLLAAASPWSKRTNETKGRQLPPNVSARSYNYRELRDLYASAALVVVPLYETDFQAGVTTILEAMAMGKAVIVSHTVGQRDVIEDGITGLYVPPGDPSALRSAINRVLADPSLAADLGRNARRTVESTMSLDLWAGRIAKVMAEQAAERSRT